MAVVSDLIPGDRVTQAGVTAVFITQAEHPLWPSLRFVVWRMDDGSWSHDALLPDQDVGWLIPVTQNERAAWLVAALLHPSQWPEQVPAAVPAAWRWP